MRLLKMSQTICLNMIVKNEAAIIEETLTNITDHIKLDYYVISDTGSTDDTVGVIHRFFDAKGIAGEIHHDGWQNFAYNRNQALKHAKGKTDYVLIFDADDRFEGKLELPELTADRYRLRMRNATGSVIYYRPLLLRNDGTFYWRGVLHEFIETDKQDTSEATLHGDYMVLSGRFGARSNMANKYLLDAVSLEKAFYSPEDEDLKPRYAFYAARSYWDSDMPERASEWFKKRIELGGWVEEVTVSYQQLGECYKLMGKRDEALATWLAGYDYNPRRAECLYLAQTMLRQEGKYRISHAIGLMAKRIPFPKDDILFVQNNVYQLDIDYELSVTAYAAGDLRQGYESCRHLLLLNVREALTTVTMQNMWLYREHAQTETREVLEQLVAVMQPYAAQGGRLAEVTEYFADILKNH